ncbi:MAG: thermosome subunit alpha, partial [Candidatus Pacearchaeota archaeon]
MEKQPIYILPENVYRLIGKDAQRNNIMAARIVADMVKSTLGPKGMDKMLVDNLGDIIVTNDGVTILEEMQVEHPAAKMMVEIAKTQEAEVGDGTTTAVVLAGKLLENAEKLLDEKIHPSVIVRGYQKAQEKAEEILEKQLSVKITEKDREILKKIATTAMTGKGAETAREKLANIIVDAITSVIEKKDGKLFIDIDSIKLEKKKGYGIEDTELIKGIVLDKERVSENMPTYIKNAKIALIDCALEIKTPETDTKISITSPEQLQAFIEQEEKMLEDMAEKIIKSGANVVLCQKGIDDLVQYYLARAGIMAVR